MWIGGKRFLKRTSLGYLLSTTLDGRRNSGEELTSGILFIHRTFFLLWLHSDFCFVKFLFLDGAEYYKVWAVLGRIITNCICLQCLVAVIVVKTSLQPPSLTAMTTLSLLHLSLMTSMLFFFLKKNHCLYIIDLYFVSGSADGKNVDSESDVVQETDEDEGDHGHKKNVKVASKKKAIKVHDSDSEDV